MRTKFISILAVTVSSVFGQAPTEPRELVGLRESFHRARDAAVSPLQKKYVDALTDMKARFTKAGNLEAALAVDAELKSLQSPDSIPAPAQKPAPQPKAPGKRLTTSEKKTIRSYFVTKTWEFTTKHADGPYYEWFYFNDDGTGRRQTSSGEIKPTLRWTLSDDGELTLGSAGYTKKVRFTSPEKATFTNELPDGSTEVGEGATLSSKTIPEK